MQDVAAISVRGLDETQLRNLKAQARRQGVSLNRLVLQRITEAEPGSNQSRADLDALAGTWTQEEAEAFGAAIAPLEQIDSGLWS
jgi:hypothetical protein